MKNDLEFLKKNLSKEEMGFLAEQALELGQPEDLGQQGILCQEKRSIEAILDDAVNLNYKFKRSMYER